MYCWSAIVVENTSASPEANNTKLPPANNSGVNISAANNTEPPPANNSGVNNTVPTAENNTAVCMWYVKMVLAYIVLCTLINTHYGKCI